MSAAMSARASSRTPIPRPGRATSISIWAQCERFAREFAMATARDIHAEDRAVIAAGQRGLSSGALKHIHFQTQEALCRHLFNGVRDAVESWKVEQATAGCAA
ncbi:SRPBCC family protein [Sphingomonas cavernae]|uniref:Aromatic-ring-hydroxylating dioxygenase alpha subunit C-terminal domain-containing protein n=1 Tax=Sphingomonas cavernae TaxID=2320861 RepID=A0A418WNL0_9SPHN|nr:hypothetical protein D3876_13680 [Sphingomonas cavernae]